MEDQAYQNSNEIPHGKIPLLEEQQLITLKNRLIGFSIAAIVCFPFFYVPFPILALVFACDIHHKKVERINSKQMFCTETHNFWTLMYVMLALTYLFVASAIIFSLQNGALFYFIFLVLAALIYLMQAFYFRQFFEAYERAFAMGASIAGQPEQSLIAQEERVDQV